jgi:hypothetical protein
MRRVPLGQQMRRADYNDVSLPHALPCHPKVSTTDRISDIPLMKHTHTPTLRSAVMNSAFGSLGQRLVDLECPARMVTCSFLAFHSLF